MWKTTVLKIYTLATAATLLAFDTTSSKVFVNASSPSCLPCIDRSKVKIGVVHHGGPTDPFWTSMNIAIRQGAKDMGVRLLFNPREEELDQEEVYTAMIEQIQKMCSTDGLTVDAILVSLPSSTIVDALDTCKTNNITINTFNAGPDLAKEAGYLFFGQDETDAGYSAGEALAKVPSTEKFCCTDDQPNFSVVEMRCGAMKSGVEENGKSNVFDVSVDSNNCDAWKSAIVESCSPDEGKDWSTVGLYFPDQGSHKCGVEFLREYNAAYAVASDVSEELYAGMKDGLNILFGIDQQSYLQGYLPFSHLTLAVTNDQMIENDYIQTGPHQVTEPPSEHFEECAENNFEVCSDDDDASLITTSDGEVIDTSAPDEPTADESTPTTDASPTPSSRSLSQSTDYTHHITLAFGGIIMAIGGYLLAN